ncbi:MAG: amino acid permease [Moorella sp. (in: Bacteria)]|nr:amino acid permease [Moorella sp. (in: firmicutes)]
MASWRIKPIEQLLTEKEKGVHRLRKILSPFDLTALGLGAIVGMGVFVLTGVAAARYAGPGVVFSFLVAGLASSLAALVYAEMAAAIPVAGSAYTFTYATLGELLAWLVGWNLVLEYVVAAGAVSIGWSGYLVNLLQSAGINLPPLFTSSPFAGGLLNLPALAITGLVTALIISGTQHSAVANKLIVALKVGVLLLFIFLGARHINPANWQPLLPFGVAGIFHGAAIIFFAFIGFDAVATAAEEVKNPRRDLPLGIFASLFLATILYIGVTAVLTGMVKYSALDNASPMAYALLSAGLRWGSALTAVGALAGLTSVMLVNIYGQSRIFFAMSRDGLLPPIFSWVHPRLRTPVVDSLLIGTVVAVIGALLPIDIVAELANIGTLTAFMAVSLGVLILRRTRPELPRPFKVPASPWLPLASFGAALYLALNLPALTWLRFVIWMALGLVIYFAYGYRHSKLREKEPGRTLLFPAPARKPEKEK